MKKYFKYTILLFLSLLALLFFSKEFRIFITQPLRVENLKIVNSLNISEMKLQIPKQVQEKFDLIYSKYRNKNFVKYLNKNNQWENAKLEYLNKTYNILVKLHGKTPSQHFENEYYSLGVKMLDNDKINGVSRFNLIVYWRIRYKSGLIKYLAKKTNLYYKENILTKIKINDKREKLYYFEFRTNKEYFKKINKNNLISLKGKNDHSLIYCVGDIESYKLRLKKAIKKIDVNDSTKNIIYNEYLALSKAIYEKDLKKVLTHFDVDYLSRVQAFRYLYADNGHGFYGGNLLMAFNTSNLKFYPIVHRDNSTKFKTKEIKGLYNGSDLIGNPGTLFNTLSKSNVLAEKTKNYLTKLLSSRSINEYSMDSIIKNHNKYYYSSNFKQSFNWESPSPSRIHMLNLISRLTTSSRN